MCVYACVCVCVRACVCVCVRACACMCVRARYRFGFVSQDLIQSCCKDIHDYLAGDSKRVAAIHCKAGKVLHMNLLLLHMDYRCVVLFCFHSYHYYHEACATTHAWVLVFFFESCREST